MKQAIKLGRYLSSQLTLFCLSSINSTRSIKGGGCCVRLVQVGSGNNHNKQSNFHNMDKQQLKTSDHMDQIKNVMEETFELKYATRCDDEGFGGVYGGNDESVTDEIKIFKHLAGMCCTVYVHDCGISSPWQQPRERGKGERSRSQPKESYRESLVSYLDSETEINQNLQFS